jgi:hypothetical protein
MAAPSRSAIHAFQDRPWSRRVLIHGTALAIKASSPVSADSTLARNSNRKRASVSASLAMARRMVWATDAS